MNFRETMVGIFAEFVLFLTVISLLAGAASVVAALEEDPKVNVGVGTVFILAASAMYNARGYLEKQQWKRLFMATLIAVTALTASVIGASAVIDADAWETVKGLLGVTIISIIVVSIGYVIRILYLSVMYVRKFMIVKRVQSGKYSEAVKLAEKCEWFVSGANYVKSPRKLSKSVALKLSCALEKLGREDDAERVRSANGFRNPSR